MRRARLIVMRLTVLLSLLSVARAAPEADAKARTAAFIAAFEAVQAAPAGQAPTPALIAANQERFAALDGFLQRRALLDGALGKHAATLDAAQRARFDALFWALLRAIAYPDSGAFFRAAEHSVSRVAVEGETARVTVHARVAADDLETDITLVWRPHEGALRLVDVAFDGASLLTDYQNQFGRIIAKKGVDGLLATLAERHAKMGLGEK